MEKDTQVNKPKTRATNVPGSQVGIQRHDLYQQAIDHIRNAMTQGFYLEAITLIESMIADRLESYLTAQLGQETSFKVLGDLINLTKKHSTDEKLRNLVANELDSWRILRNHALHAMVKIEEGNTETWEMRVSQLPDIAKQGLAIMYKISDRVAAPWKAKQRKAAKALRLAAASVPPTEE